VLKIVIRLIALLGIMGAALPAVAQNYIEGQHYWFEAAVFPGIAPKDHPRGPGKAKGVVMWNDGYSTDRAAPEKVPPLMQALAEAGWDVFNLQRHSVLFMGRGDTVSSEIASSLILFGIDSLKARGYRQVILSGQSRGAYASILAGSYKTDVLGIVPLAPAGFGDYTRSSDWMQNDLAIRVMWEKYAGSPIRVAAGFFSGDDWFETKRPNVRGPYAEKRLTELGVANFIVSEPPHTGMSTHFGGTSWQFGRRYGPCLDQFFETGKRPACEDADPATAATFGIRPAPADGSDGYTGVWQGTWWNGRFIALTVRPPENGIYKVAYQLGRGVNGDKVESTEMSFTEKDGMLVRDQNVEFRLQLNGDGTLAVSRIDRNKRSEESEKPNRFVRVTAR
jgi:hypothetical protein